MPFSFKAFRCSGSSRRASSPPWTFGWRVLTRPSQISGNPVTSLMLMTSTPLSRSSFIVPPVAITSQPSARSPLANSTTPVLSLTLINARMLLFFFCVQ